MAAAWPNPTMAMKKNASGKPKSKSGTARMNRAPTERFSRFAPTATCAKYAPPPNMSFLNTQFTFTNLSLPFSL